MSTDELIKKRIRDSAPYRKSIAMSKEDMERAIELERIYGSKYSFEAPFNFSKTISKALEIAYLQALIPAHGNELQDKLEGTVMGSSKEQTESKGDTNKKYQKNKRGYR